MQYNRARYYDPANGRWVTQDPMGFSAGDSNLFRYVTNAPTIGTDPTGLLLFSNTEVAAEEAAAYLRSLGIQSKVHALAGVGGIGSSYNYVISGDKEKANAVLKSVHGHRWGVLISDILKTFVSTKKHMMLSGFPLSLPEWWPNPPTKRIKKAAFVSLTSDEDLFRAVSRANGISFDYIEEFISAVKRTEVPFPEKLKQQPVTTVTEITAELFGLAAFAATKSPFIRKIQSSVASYAIVRLGLPILDRQLVGVQHDLCQQWVLTLQSNLLLL